MKKVAIGLVCSAILLAVLFLPAGELISWAEFRLFPGFAKRAHFLRLRKSGQTIYLLGTVHGEHFRAGASYPYWELKSALDSLGPKLLLVEIRPLPLGLGLWGEGPPEMPYAVAIARNAGIAVKGMDFWRPHYQPAKDFDDREDHMASLILDGAKGQPVALVLTGFSHVTGLERRLRAAGFARDDSFTSQEKLNVLSRPESDRIPKDYFEAVTQAAERSSQRKSDYPAEWAEYRFGLLKTLAAKGGTP